MTNEQRDVITFFCLFILPYGFFRAWHAARRSDDVYNGMPGTDRTVRDPLQTAKWLLVGSFPLGWFTVQGWIDPLAIFRPVMAVGLLINQVLIAILLDQGYTRWWNQVKDWVLARRRSQNNLRRDV